RGGSRRVAAGRSRGAIRYKSVYGIAPQNRGQEEREKGTGRAAGSAPVQKIRAHFRSARLCGVELTNLRGRLSDREFRELRRALARDAVGRGDSQEVVAGGQFGEAYLARVGEAREVFQPVGLNFALARVYEFAPAAHDDGAHRDARRKPPASCARGVVDVSRKMQARAARERATGAQLYGREGGRQRVVTRRLGDDDAA